jgi:hypothetical protein
MQISSAIFEKLLFQLFHLFAFFSQGVGSLTGDIRGFFERLMGTGFEAFDGFIGGFGKMVCGCGHESVLIRKNIKKNQLFIKLDPLTVPGRGQHNNNLY